MFEKIAQRKLPLSLLVSNGGILIGLLWGAFSFYQQVNASTEAISHVSDSVDSVEERIDRSNVDGLSDMYFQLNDQIQVASQDITWQIDELQRETGDRIDRIKEDAGWLAERLSSMEAQLQQLDEEGWKAEEIQREIGWIKESLAVLQASNTEWDLETVENDLSYLKERVIWLEAQGTQEVDTGWLEEQINDLYWRTDEASGRLDHIEGMINELYVLISAAVDRLTLLENVGNHQKLLEKARSK